MTVGTFRQATPQTTLDAPRRAGRPSRLRTALHSLRRRFPATDEEVRTAKLRRLGRVCAVLEGAHRTVEGGWVQNRWFARQAPSRSSGAGTITDAPLSACLVGAVLYAGRHEQEHVGPAVDFLWDAWQQVRGLDGPGVGGRSAPPAVRAARVRDLTRWNDEPGRTRDDVLRLLDVASTRTIMEAMSTPAVHDPARSPVVAPAA